MNSLLDVELAQQLDHDRRGITLRPLRALLRRNDEG